MKKAIAGVEFEDFVLRGIKAGFAIHKINMYQTELLKFQQGGLLDIAGGGMSSTKRLDMVNKVINSIENVDDKKRMEEIYRGIQNSAAKIGEIKDEKLKKEKEDELEVTSGKFFKAIQFELTRNISLLTEIFDINIKESTSTGEKLMFLEELRINAIEYSLNCLRISDEDKKKFLENITKESGDEFLSEIIKEDENNISKKK